MTPQTTPVKLDLQRDKQLQIDWQDGHHSTYSIDYLRSNCPCAACKLVRKPDQDPHSLFAPVEENQPRKRSLTILPGNYSAALHAVSAELVGNYAIKIDWSDNHGAGIYSFQYLRSIDPRAPEQPT